MITLEAKLEPDDKWNDRMLNSKTGTFVQTKEFALSKKLFGAKPLFLTFLENNGNILGQMVVFLHQKYQNKGKIGRILKHIPGGKNMLCRWFYGPVIFEQDYEIKIQNELFNFLNLKKFLVWGSAHPFSNCSFSNFKKPFHIINWGTFILDLKNGRNSLWENMDKHSARKNVERSKTRNVHIKKMNKKDLSLFLNLSMESGKISDYTSLPTMEKQWELLQPVGYDGFIAFEGDVPISAIKIASFNGYLYEFEVVRTKRDYLEKLYSQDLLKWYIIEWGIKNNFSFYDLAGINPSPITEKEKGIFHYKQKWGGKLIKYNIIKS